MMKKQLLLVAALLLGVATFAQTADSLKNAETPAAIDSEQENSILSRGSERGELVLSVGSQQITLGSASSEKRLEKNSATVSVKGNRIALGLSAFEIGYSLLTSIDYSGFAPSEHGFMDQRIGRSIHVGWRFFDMQFGLTRTGSVALIAGVSLGWDNYHFEPSWSIEKVDNQILPVALEPGYKKSKLATSYVGLPLGLKFRPARHVELSVIGYADLVDRSWTKVTKPKSKHDLHGVNKFRFGFEVAASYKNFGVYYKHSFTPLFESGVGPKCYPISVGLAWGF